MTLRVHLIPGIKATRLGEAVGQGARGTLIHAGGNVRPVSMEIRVEVPQKLNVRLPYDPALTSLSPYLKALY